MQTNSQISNYANSVSASHHHDAFASQQKFAYATATQSQPILHAASQGPVISMHKGRNLSVQDPCMFPAPTLQQNAANVLMQASQQSQQEGAPQIFMVPGQTGAYFVQTASGQFLQLVPAQMNNGTPTPQFTPTMQSAVQLGGEADAKSAYMGDFIKFSNEDYEMQKRGRAESSMAEQQNLSKVEQLVDFTVVSKQHLKTEDDERFQVVATSNDQRQRTRSHSVSSHHHPTDEVPVENPFTQNFAVNSNRQFGSSGAQQMSAAKSKAGSSQKTSQQQFLCPVQYNEVYVWGSNQVGQLGLGEADIEGRDDESCIIDLPKICCFNTVIQKVACGLSHTLLLSQSGHVYSMGSNQYGQLGLNMPFTEVDCEGEQVALKKALPCLVDALKEFFISDIAVGNDHCLAVTEDGAKLFSWGQGKFGALGSSKSQNVKRPQEIELKRGTKVYQIAAGSRHSAYVSEKSRQLYMFGLALHGQLGLGEDCTDRAFKPERVPFEDDVKIEMVALGDSHSIVLTSQGHLMASGANDKYQLGIDPEKRSLKLFEFQRLQQFKTGERSEKVLSHEKVSFKHIACWNLNAAVDQDDRVYLWGILHDKHVKQSLCIKLPERVNSFKVAEVAVGPTMALLVDRDNHQPCVIGVNARGELGLGDCEQRKTFQVLTELKHKRIKQAAIGKSGYVFAISEQVVDPASFRDNTVEAEEPAQMPMPHELQQQVSQPDSVKHIEAAEGDTLASAKLKQVMEQVEMATSQNSSKALQEISQQVKDLTNLTHLNMRIHTLEAELNKKSEECQEGDRRHADLVAKIQGLEDKLAALGPNQRVVEVQRELASAPVSYASVEQARGASPCFAPGARSSHSAGGQEIFIENHSLISSQRQNIPSEQQEAFASKYGRQRQLQSEMRPGMVDEEIQCHRSATQPSIVSKSSVGYHPSSRYHIGQSAAVTSSEQESVEKSMRISQERQDKSAFNVSKEIKDYASDKSRRVKRKTPRASDDYKQYSVSDKSIGIDLEDVSKKSRARNTSITKIVSPATKSVRSMKSQKSHKSGHSQQRSTVVKSSKNARSAVDQETVQTGSLVVENERLQEELERKDNELHILEQRVTHLNQKLDSLVKFLEQERQMRQEAEDLANTKEMQLVGCQNELMLLKDRGESVQHDLKVHLDSQESMRKEISKLVQERREAQDQKREAENKLMDAEARLRVSQKEIDQLKATLQNEIEERRAAQRRARGTPNQDIRSQPVTNRILIEQNSSKKNTITSTAPYVESFGERQTQDYRERYHALSGKDLSLGSADPVERRTKEPFTDTFNSRHIGSGIRQERQTVDAGRASGPHSTERVQQHILPVSSISSVYPTDHKKMESKQFTSNFGSKYNKDLSPPPMTDTRAGASNTKNDPMSKRASDVPTGTERGSIYSGFYAWQAPPSGSQEPPKFGFERWKDRGDYQFGYKRIGESDDEDDRALYKPVAANRTESGEVRRNVHGVDSRHVRSSSGGHPLRLKSKGSQEEGIGDVAARYENNHSRSRDDRSNAMPNFTPNSYTHMEVQRSVSREPRPLSAVPTRYPEADRPRGSTSKNRDSYPIYVSRFGRDMSAKGHDAMQPAGPVSNMKIQPAITVLNHSYASRSSANEAERAANLRDERVRPYRSTSNERARPGADLPSHSNYMKQLQEHKYGAEEQASALISNKYFQPQLGTTLSDTYASKVDASAFNTSQQFMNDFNQMPSMTHVGPGSRAGSTGKVANQDQPTTFRSRIESLLPEHMRKEFN